MLKPIGIKFNKKLPIRHILVENIKYHNLSRRKAIEYS